MDKSTVLKAFCTHFFEFLDDLISIFPENRDIKDAKTAMEMVRSGNASILPKTWYSYVYIPYNDQIEAGDLEYFLNKDYSQDLANLANADNVGKAIDKIRSPIRSMSPDSKEKALKYIQNLNKLCVVYMKLSGKA